MAYFKNLTNHNNLLKLGICLNIMALKAHHRLIIQALRHGENFSSGDVASVLGLPTDLVDRHILETDQLMGRYAGCLNSLKAPNYMFSSISPPKVEGGLLEVRLLYKKVIDAGAIQRDVKSSLNEGRRACGISSGTSFEVFIGEKRFLIASRRGAYKGFCFLRAYSDLLSRNVVFED